ncbi:hypothetical protein M422DRAFT_164750 [Sphaerobolus stellatus SS14]|uniref:Unplaced genomic scaffold SPHSTscaffold_30, whole genome shotgun sequence n=1 Tax=Sphaerobolus stellatus (strain SS14) TaxID=990650 RepID=A0A0C9W542_SPHS4|nr:hypothetical protein M422DRAFT_164750 [Sphaerobolus stellatus SS14]
MPLPTIPPFPDNVPTHPLRIIDYQLIKAKDEMEMESLWEAAKSLGFWYLKNHGADDEVDTMFDFSAEVMALPLEEKMEFTQGDGGNSFGYKYIGGNTIEASGLRDSNEFFNISKDDAFSYPIVTHRTYPALINNNMETVVAPFIRKSLEVTRDLVNVLNDKLCLPFNELGKRHNLNELSGNEARLIRIPPNLSLDRKALGHHTDFGSISFLHNRLGGLQVLPPGSDRWQYIRPIPGHAICNVGDALHILSGGILRSNIHRVLAPPGAQSHYERSSVVFFLRPGNSVILNALTEQSPMIKKAMYSADSEKFMTNTTAEVWQARRFKYRRAVNQKGPETWYNGQGTEGRDYT